MGARNEGSVYVMLPVYPEIIGVFRVPLQPHFNQKMGKKSVPFCRELSRNFGVDLCHFSVRFFDSSGVTVEVNNFGVRR